MRKPRRPKCRHCHQVFVPDPRNAGRQKHCSLPACRKASKAASQKKWLNKPDNQNYFQSSENTARVQQWRKDHPGYWRKKQNQQEPLQDPLLPKYSGDQHVTLQKRNNALQDLLSVQPIVFLGLLAQLSGSPLQDDIVTIGRRLQQLGQDILTQPTDCKGGQYDSQQNAPMSPHDSPGPGPVQLGGSPSGR